MKSLLVICTVFLFAAVVRSDTEEEKKIAELINEHVGSCTEELQLPPEWSTWDDTKLSGENKDKAACLLACIMKRMGVMDGTQVVMEKLQETLKIVYTDDDKLAEKTKVMASCVEEVKDITNECEVASAFMACTHKE
ncbi:PREDICTED: uncharacterized protein LOC107191806 [Dufourea novaeangliae]|uniref:Pheromone-binding protein-related protein 2 n=1 Tax=Dufourea novaeangliae TaxID=178035 RepID=A0A154PNX1_DUFNO|nr:PREDICTED: uncharacterized protein LOC107191806 [Dufourea novaeangliae]KZC13559.1 hypothetical protein WN55_05111 [Dufourea novaeangliae]